MKLAAIDIGSNAARLLITEVTESENEKPVFTKLNLVRVPLRLGFDVFEKGEIGSRRGKMLIQTMQAFSLLIKTYEVDHVVTCATSAMRDAKNSAELINAVKDESGLEIKIISGDVEATMIYENHIAENLDREHAYLYIDVGGGSTELTFIADGKLQYKESVNIGTIRILKDMVTDEHWNVFKEKVKQNVRSKLPVIAIGSGGNINKVFSMSKRKEGKPLTYELLKDYYKELSSFSVGERIRLYQMKDDRADVIVPALKIYVNVMRWADINEIYVPKIGLADGLVQSMYEQLKLAGKIEM